MKERASRMVLASRLYAGALGMLMAWHTSAAAEESAFCARLSGGEYGASTGSSATGTALIRVNIKDQTVDLQLAIEGIAIADLSDRLRPAPVGPIHLHLYPTQDHSPDTPVMLAMPVPFGPEYAEADSGFSVAVKGYSYSGGAELLGSSLGFDEFVQALGAGQVVLNIHTNRFPEGEISGTVVSDCDGS